MRTTGVIAGIALLAMGAWGQSDQKPASLSGTVVNSVTGEPVVRAHVMARCVLEAGGAQSPKIFGALTTDKGTFSIGQLPVGHCWLRVEKVGFVPSTPSTTYDLASGSSRDDIKLTLVPAGAIVGRILDSAGDPAPGANVAAEGLGGSFSAVTDNQGRYRISGLPPGKYRVRASTHSKPFQPEIRNDGKREMRDAATYYPGSLDAAGAQKVEVKGGMELTGTDIRLVRTPIVEVSGTVTGLPQGLKDGLVVELWPNGPTEYASADGRFAIWRADPGKYSLVAFVNGMGEPSPRSAPLEIEVTIENIQHLELHIMPPFDLAGQVRFQDANAPGQAPTPSPRPQRRINLQSATPDNDGSMTATLADDDTFTLSKVTPDRYRVSLTWPPSYVKSVRAGDRETEGDMVDLRNGAAGPITVTASSETCEISGVVSDSHGPVEGAWVMALRAGTLEGFHSMRTDPTGQYYFRGLAPGKYKVAQVDDGSEFLRPRDDIDLDMEGAVDLDLRAGDKVTKDLRRQ